MAIKSSYNQVAYKIMEKEDGWKFFKQSKRRYKA